MWASPRSGCSGCATGCASGISLRAGCRRRRLAATLPTWCSAGLAFRTERQFAQGLTKRTNERGRVAAAQFQQQLFEEAILGRTRGQAIEESIDVGRQEHRDRPDQPKADQALDHGGERIEA